MTLGNLKISRWVLLPELALCFVPLAFGWYSEVFGASSGIFNLTPEIIRQFFLSTPRGTFMLIYMLGEAVLGLLGPVALALGTAFIVVGRPVLGRRQAIVLLAVAGLLALLFTARLLFNVVYLDSTTENLGGYATSLLMFSLLPAAGIAHLWYLGRVADWSAAVRSPSDPDR